jgi:PAS domain S-box-containing protein
MPQGITAHCPYNRRVVSGEETIHEARFRLLVESVEDYAIFMLDPRGIITTWNAGAERLKGYEAEEIIGKPVDVFYTPEDRATDKAMRELERATHDGRYEEEGWRVRKDGSRFWANVVLTALRDERDTLVGFAKVTRDLTERRQAEDERVRLVQEAAGRRLAEHTATLLARLNAIAGALGAARAPEEIANVIVTRGAEALGAATASFMRPIEGRFELVASYGMPDEMVRAWKTFSVDVATPVAAAYHEGKPQWIESPSELLERFPAPASMGGSVAALPLAVGDTVFAVMAFRFDGARVFTTEERSLLQTMAAQAAQAYERAVAHERERATSERLRVLVDLSEALSKTLSVADVARVAIERGMRMAGADTCTLHALDGASEELVLVDQEGCSAEIVERIRRIEKAGLQAMWAETAAEYAATIPSVASMPTSRVKALLSVPLVAEGRAIGLLGMGFFAERRFSPESREMVVSFAHQCAEAILRAKRLDGERAARASLATTLRSIGDAVMATDESGAIAMMNPVAEALTKWSEADARGRQLPEVFRIVNEQTRATVQSPVEKVFELGAVVGLANHTLLIARDGTEIPIEDSGAPIRGEDGAIDGVVLVFRDGTEKKLEETRRTFLADATGAIAESLDYEATLARATQLAVPGIADWCAVDVVEEGELVPKRLAVAHVDPAKVELAKELEAKYPPDPAATTGLPNVLRTGRSELYPEITDELLELSSADAEQSRIARELGLRSAMIVPLVSRGRTLGAITFVMAESGRRYDEDDLRFAEDLARRFAVAIENARLFRAEQVARTGADVANRAKDEFLAVVSHELRTPLNAIVGWAKLMAAADFDESRRDRAVDTIVRNAVAMAQLIEDLLDMSRIISGKMRLDVQPVQLAPVISAALDSINPAAEAKDIRVLTSLDKSAAPLVGDPARLQQIVWNLLSNAVKFTPRGGTVTVTLCEDDGHARVEVSDTGIGIAQRFLPYVFDAFSQEDARISRSRGGLGLGLAITRQLVELHGGRIEARSDGEGAGSTFVVRIPFAARAFVADVVPKREPAPKWPEQLRGLRVLVVDDEADARELAKAILDDCGCEVALAASVVEALASFESAPPDVLLADISMPERDGYDLIRHVRRMPRERGGAIPAAALTAYTRVEDKRRILDAGYTMHLAKPIEPRELAEVVASLTRFTS